MVRALYYRPSPNLFKENKTMTINELLNKIVKQKPNSFTQADLIAFVNEIEAEVAEQLGITGEDVPVYDTTDLSTELLVGAPYDRLYVSYLKAQIDYATEEYDSYANNQAQHVQDFQDFTDWVVREGKKQTTATGPRRFRHITRW